MTGKFDGEKFVKGREGGDYYSGFYVDWLEERIEELEEALGQIRQWANAYPLDVFPEPDFKKAHKLLKDGGMTLDAISASNMRHVVEGVGGIAKEALAGESDLDKLTTQQKPTEEAMEEA